MPRMCDNLDLQSIYAIDQVFVVTTQSNDRVPRLRRKRLVRVNQRRQLGKLCYALRQIAAASDASFFLPFLTNSLTASGAISLMV